MFEVVVTTIVVYSIFTKADIAIANTKLDKEFNNSIYSKYETLKRLLANLEAFRDKIYICFIL
jgi:hypothetical protein